MRTAKTANVLTSLASSCSIETVFRTTMVVFWLLERGQHTSNSLLSYFTDSFVCHYSLFSYFISLKVLLLENRFLHTLNLLQDGAPLLLC